MTSPRKSGDESDANEVMCLIDQVKPCGSSGTGVNVIADREVARD